MCGLKMVVCTRLYEIAQYTRPDLRILPCLLSVEAVLCTVRHVSCSVLRRTFIVSKRAFLLLLLLLLLLLALLLAMSE